MPRLTLWKPNKGNDYEFIDRSIGENMLIGGVGVLVHKYIGPTKDGDHTDIEDLLFLENRNRFYEESVYEMRCVYTPQDVDYDLTQFGIFLSSDMLRIDFHYNDMFDMFGRKLFSGDVIEFPNMRDTTLSGVAINKYYVIQDSLFSSSGYGQDWRPHLWKVRAKEMTASPEFEQIIDDAAKGDTAGGEGDGTGLMPPGWTGMVDGDGNPGPGCDHDVKDALDRFCFILDITDGIVAEAEDNAFYDPKFFETPHLYITMSEEGYPCVNHFHSGDGIPPNGAPLKGMGTSFPEDMNDGEYFLRVDYKPDRLFQKQGNCFAKIEDDLRRYWTASNTRLDTYINNIELTNLEGGDTIRQKQPLSKVIPQKVDQYAEHRAETKVKEAARQRIAKKLDGAT